jgi:hypothetical protein
VLRWRTFICDGDFEFGGEDRRCKQLLLLAIGEQAVRI